MNTSNLVNLALKGDNAARTELYNLTCDKAFSLALQMTKNKEEAEDILHDSYIKAFSSLQTMTNAANFPSWFYCIVSNKCKDYLKSKRRGVVMFSDLEGEDDNGDEREFELEDTSEDYSPEANADVNETARLIREMINNLPEDQRMVVIMYYLNRLTIKEIAQALDVSENTVKSRLRYAKQKLKLDVEELYQLPELPTGCESVALTIALRSLGFKLEKTDIAENYLIHDEDVMYGYAGDPFEEDGAGVFPPGLTDTANNYLADQGSDYVALNTMGTDFEDLYKIISAGYPVVLWTTMYFTPPLIEDYGYFYGEDVYYWYHSEHCVTLTGYDTETGMVTISDPLTGIVKCKAKDIEDIYNKTGKLSMAIIKGSRQQNWQADDYDYEIMG